MFTKATVSMVCITTLLIIALLNQVDGVLLAGGIAALAGLGGYEVGKHRKP